MKRLLPFVIIAIVLGGGLLTARYLSKPTSPTPPAPAPPTAPGVSPTIPVVVKAEPGSEPAHALGSANAKVTLEEFGDFQCPPCGLMHPILKQFAKDYDPAQLRIIFREYPLVPTHVHALAAARAAEAAGVQGKFWEMHDMIYETQKEWADSFDARPTFEGYASKIGLNLDKFRQDINSENVEQRIFLDGKRGHSMKVQGTPTVFLNGREVPFESLEPSKLKGLIDAELAAH